MDLCRESFQEVWLLPINSAHSTRSRGFQITVGGAWLVSLDFEGFRAWCLILK